MTPEWCVLYTATGHTVQGSGHHFCNPACSIDPILVVDDTAVPSLEFVSVCLAKGIPFCLGIFPIAEDESFDILGFYFPARKYAVFPYADEVILGMFAFGAEVYFVFYSHFISSGFRVSG